MTRPRPLPLAFLTLALSSSACWAENLDAAAAEDSAAALVSVGSGALPRASDLGSLTFRSSGIPVFAKKYIFTPEPSRAHTKKRVPAGSYVQLAAAPGRGGYLDGRLRVKSSGCFSPYVVSQRTAESTTLPTTYATGNVAWKNWYCANGRCTGEGRLAGLYGGESLEADASVSLGAIGQTKGLVIGTVGQSMRAKARMGDSAEVDFGNYGANQTIRVRVTNEGTSWSGPSS